MNRYERREYWRQWAKRATAPDAAGGGGFPERPVVTMRIMNWVGFNPEILDNETILGWAEYNPHLITQYWDAREAA